MPRCDGGLLAPGLLVKRCHTPRLSAWGLGQSQHWSLNRGHSQASIAGHEYERGAPFCRPKPVSRRNVFRWER